jgi:hypothetical protein
MDGCEKIFLCACSEIYRRGGPPPAKLKAARALVQHADP